MNDPFFSATECSRCHGKLTARIMSKFDQAVICMECKEDERHAPGYAAADAAEVSAVRSGQRDFPGVGLSQADRDFLAKKRDERRLRSMAASESKSLTSVGGLVQTIKKMEADEGQS